MVTSYVTLTVFGSVFNIFDILLNSMWSLLPDNHND